MDPFEFNWRHLRALLVIADHSSLSAAARAVHLSQPALTKGLAKLEAALGRPLFVRTSTGVEPTEGGRRMAERTTRAWVRLARAVAAVTPRGAGGGGEKLMTATQLRAVVAVVDAGGFAAARAATGLSEPALHRAVREVEQIVGRSLVERRGRGVQVAPAGRMLARGIRLAAREIAAGIAEAIEDQAAVGPLLIGAMPLARARVLPLAVAALQREDPAAATLIVEGSWRDLVEPLRDGALDLMIGALRPSIEPDLVQAPLFQDRLVVVGRVGHPLVGANTDLDRLARFPWIVGTPGTPLRTQWEATFAGQRPPAAPVACGSTVAIRTMLAHSDMLTLLSPDQVDVEIDAGVLAIVAGPLPGSVREIGIVTRADWRPTGRQRRLLELLGHAAGTTKPPEKA